MATRGAVITGAAVTPIKWNIVLGMSINSEPKCALDEFAEKEQNWGEGALLTLAHLIDRHNLENDLQDHRAPVEYFL